LNIVWDDEGRTTGFLLQYWKRIQSLFTKKLSNADYVNPTFSVFAKF